jgi:hypothetical protein
MKSLSAQPQYLVQLIGAMPVRWNGQGPLALGHPSKILVEIVNGAFRARRLDSEVGVATRVHSVQMGSQADETIEVATGVKVRIRRLNTTQAVNFDLASKIQVEAITDSLIESPEDLNFKTQMKRGASAALALLLVVVGSKLMEPPIKTDESIIPQKYAKLIMTKPKELSKGSSGSQAAARSETKAVARAFKTRTVQNSLKNILRGGLTKYSVMNTGRSIETLSKKMAGTESLSGLGLDAKAGAALAGGNPGQTRAGSADGYGTATGANVHGQGHGQLEIGLNTKDASVDEGLTKDEVARVIHSHMNEIRFCYESAIMKDPNIAGKLLVDFKINASGSVPNAGISEAGIQNRDVGQCLLGKLKSWKFPQPRGGVLVAVSYPFVFKSLSR